MKNRIREYLRRPAEERRTRRAPIDDEMFYRGALRDEVMEAFSSRCAFCETETIDGVVLHFRPLRHLEVSPKEFLPDFYLWLAFEWRNIFFACEPCAKSKGQLFPVMGERAHYLSSYQSLIRREKPLLIDPARESHYAHIAFNAQGYATSLTARGRATVDAFSLNRSELVQARHSSIEWFGDALRLTNRSDHVRDVCEELLRRPYAGSVGGFIVGLASMWMPSAFRRRQAFSSIVDRLAYQWGRANEQEKSRLFDLWVRINPSDSGYEQVDYISLDLSRDEMSRSLRSNASSFSFKERFRDDISQIVIHGCKAIENLSVNIGDSARRSRAPALMILGENSTGKSTFLCAVALALIGEREAKKLSDYLPDFVRSNDIRRYDQLDPSDLRIDVHFGTGGDHSSLLYGAEDVDVTVSGGFDGVILAYGARRFFDIRKSSRASGNAARVRTLFNPLATIPYPEDWLRSLSHQERESVARTLRIVMSLDDSDDLIISDDGIAVSANGRVTPIDQLSEGYKSVFAMTVDIMRELIEAWGEIEYGRGIVLIDEIETHLHPRWKMQVMASLRRAFPRVQFIVTTHDPLCLRGMDDGEVIVLGRDEDGRVQQLSGLPSVRGMSAEQLLVSDYFGLMGTVDAETEYSLANLASQSSSSNAGRSLERSLPSATEEAISRITIGDTASSQVIHQAIKEFLRASSGATMLEKARARKAAVEAVVSALRGDET